MRQAIIGINYALIYWHIYASPNHNAWVPAGCQTISWTNAHFFPQDLSSITPIMSINWIQTYAFLSNIMISANRFVAIEFTLSKKQADIVLCTMNSERQDTCSTCDQH